MTHYGNMIITENKKKICLILIPKIRAAQYDKYNGNST